MFRDKEILRHLRQIEAKIDRHAETSNGHPAHSFKGIPVYWWAIIFLIAGIVGADLIIDVLTAVQSAG